MAFVMKCPKCGLDLTDTSGTNCPMCGTGGAPEPALSLPKGLAAFARPGNPSPLVTSSSRIWIAALIQIALMTTFMLLFHFPRVMIVPLVVFVLLGTAVSATMKARVRTVQAPAPPRPLAHPVLFRIAAFATALCALAFISSLLFGFVIFMNSWNRWHQYEGQPYHQSEFEITQVYFHKGSKGAIDAYASGTVEGQKEWMNLIPYLHQIPRTEAQLDELVGPGITIPIFFFPELKGRARVQFDDGILPSDAAHRDTLNALKYGSLGAVLSVGMLFLLSRLRRLCYDDAGTQCSVLSTQ